MDQKKISHVLVFITIILIVPVLFMNTTLFDWLDIHVKGYYCIFVAVFSIIMFLHWCFFVKEKF